MPRERNFQIEVCVVSLEQALAAFENGADRLELCSRLETEGMTPGIELTTKILDQANIPVRIMIRETETGFESDEDILEKMKFAITQFKTQSIDGFVIGLLKDNHLDREAMKTLIECCAPFPVTVHKAIDHSLQMMDDLKWLNQFDQVDTILTSGGKTTAKEGIPEILKMKSVFEKNIMAAGKITKDQLPFLNTALQLQWFHGRNILAHP